MSKSVHAALWILAISLWLACGVRAQTNTNIVAVAFTTANPTPLHQGLGGFSTDMLDNGLDYGNAAFQQEATAVSPGWLRYPSGIADNAFNWKTGLTDTNWINTFYSVTQSSTDTNLMWDTYEPLIGRGGAQFTNFAGMAANVGGAEMVVCLNAFTDTNTSSATGFAGFASSNHVRVSAWEMCNEPYHFTGASNYFTNATDYANKMLPYRNAIKSADSNAVIAVFFDDPAVNWTNSTWNKKLGQYSPQYWDAVTYHHYPQPGGLTNFSDLMAFDNGVLANQAASYVTNYLIKLNTNANVRYLITELAPVLGNGGGPSLPTGSLYGGIYAAEYLMRMSTLPQMEFVGSWQVADQAGIYMTNKNRIAVTTAFNGHYVTNTDNLNFGFYLSAQVCGEAIADWALTRSTATYSTAVGTNGPTVSSDTNGVATIPAIYAQAYQGANGRRYVLVTNKGSNAVPVQITQDGLGLTNQFIETFVTGADPSATNSSPLNSPVKIQTALATNAVVIPAYSVVRLEWTVFGVPVPSLTLTITNSTQVLRWAGLTNVTYVVQASTNLRSQWNVLGRIASAQTSFSFTNWSPDAARFYRLVVP